MERIDAVADWVHGDVNPDITVLLDAPAEIGLARASGRGEADRFETEAVAFFESVRSTYLELAGREADRFIVVDASDSLEVVSQRIRQVASDLIDKFKKAS